MSGALEGLIVTELGQRLSAGLCGSLLAQLGATVIAIEPAQGRADYRPHLLAGKLSFSPKPDSATDAALVQRLLRRSDCILTSSDIDAPIALPDPGQPGGPVICDITAFGASGDMAGQAWTDLQVQALSGIADTTGAADGPPMPIALPMAAILTSTYAAGAAIAALRARRLSGAGQAIDMAMFDCAFASTNSFLSGFFAGKGVTKSRMGNRHPTVAPWNLFAAQDGWVMICIGSDAQWQRLCDLIERRDLAAPYIKQADRIAHAATIDDAIAAWTGRLSVAACTAKLVEAGIASGPIAPIDGYPREANLDYRGMIREVFDPLSGRAIHLPGSPLRMSATPGRGAGRIAKVDADRDTVTRIAETPAAPLAATTKVTRALQGLRVIEIGQYTTAPLCARHLAHLGADVIKVEQPQGDEARTWVPHVKGRSISFRLNNSDKRSIALDLRKPEGAETLARLIASADVLVENLKPGALAKLGFSAARMAELNPRLVYCAITGFGADSLYAARPAFDTVIQAMSGFMAAVAPGGVPMKSGISSADTMGAEMAIVAILAALEHRDRRGRGQVIDLSMQDIAAWMTQTQWNSAAVPSAAVLKCRDGYVVVDTTLERAALPRETLAVDRAALVASLTRAGIRSAPVLTVNEAAVLPHTRARRLWATVEEDGHQWPILASPLRLVATPPTFSHLAPDLNQDRNAILQELGVPA